MFLTKYLIRSPWVLQSVNCRFHTKSIKMGRENILHYQLEKEHDTDLPQGQQTPPLEEKQHEIVKKLHSLNPNFPFTLLKESTKEDFLENNQYYINSIKHNHSNQVFELNGKGQAPHTLWIGCSDSRAGESCLATLPGEIFTHRNIGNVVTASDISSQGVIQFAVDVLKVKKIIVCGHTDCGGVWASMSSKKIGGVLDLWLTPIKQTRAANLAKLAEYEDPKMKARKLAELNVILSVTALKRHPSASMALKNGEIEVWGMMYDVATGRLNDIEIPLDEFEDLFHVHDNAKDDLSGH